MSVTLVTLAAVFSLNVRIHNYRAVIESIADETEYSVGKFLSDKPLKIIYNRVGKCGSRSLLKVISKLSTKNDFNIFFSPVHNRTFLPAPDLLDEVRMIEDLSDHTVYARHVYFIDFKKYGLVQPVYINMIRDPIERFVSEYYFLLHGDKKLNTTRAKDREPATINACILKNDPICAKEVFYIGRYFCGHTTSCKKANAVSVALAKRHLDEDYLIVGLLEDFNATLAILERMIPRYFNGARKVWEDIYQQMIHGTATNKGVPLSTRAKKKLMSKMSHEYEVYNHAKLKFNQLKNDLRL